MIFLNSASSAAAALVFYLPGWCTHTDTGGKQRRDRVQNILKSSEKTQYLMNTLYHPKQFKNERTFILKLQLFWLQLTIERVIISKCYNTYTIQYK